MSHLKAGTRIFKRLHKMYLIYLHQTVYLQIGGAAQIIVGIFVAAAFGGQHQDNRDGKLGPWGMQVYIW